MKKYKGAFLVFVFFITLILVLFYPVIKAPANMMLFGDDVFRSYGFFRQFFANSIKSGQIPWWNPYLFSGMPFMANPSVSSIYPINWIYIFIPLKTAFPLITAIHMLIAMMGMYFLGRVVVKPRLGELPAAVSGIVFGMSGYMSARIYGGHTEIIAAIAWMPWVIGFFIKSFEKLSLKSIFITAVFLSIQIYAGYQTIAMFTLEACGIIAVYYAIKNRNINPFVSLLLGLAYGLGLSALQLLPYFEFFGRSIRTMEFPYIWAVNGSYFLKNLIMFIKPFVFGDKETFWGAPPNFHEHTAFVSNSALILSLISLIVGFISMAKSLIYKNNKSVQNNQNLLILSAFSISLFGVWVALGEYAPFKLNLHRALWEILPTYRNIRIPARHMILPVLGVSILTGIGMEKLKLKLFQLLVTFILVSELIIFGRHFIETRPIPGSFHDQALIKTLNHGVVSDRVLQNFGVWVSPRDSLDFDSAAIYKIFSATGYDPSILSNYYNFADAVNNNRNSSILAHDVQIPYLNEFSPHLNFLNIGYIFSPVLYDPTDADPNRYERVMEDTAQNYHLNRNKAVAPRFFLVGNIKAYDNKNQIADHVMGGEDLIANILVTKNTLEELGKLDCPPKQIFDPVQIISYNLNRIELEVNSSCNAILSSSEVYYPGWTAVVDGVKTKIIESNMAFRAIPIAKGKHRVVMQFVPYYFIYGGLITIFVIFLMLFLLKKIDTKNK